MTFQMIEYVFGHGYINPYPHQRILCDYLPEHKVLMAVDHVVPGGVPWKHLTNTPDVPALINSTDQALALDFDVFVPGHGQTGTKQDTLVQQEYVACKKSSFFN